MFLINLIFLRFLRNLNKNSSLQLSEEKLTYKNANLVYNANLGTMKWRRQCNTKKNQMNTKNIR